MFLWWKDGDGAGGTVAIIGGLFTWFAVAVTAAAFAIIYVTLMALYAVWLIGLAAYRAVRRR